MEGGNYVGGSVVHICAGALYSAEKMARGSLSATTRVLGIKHPDTLMALEILAVVLNTKGAYEEAEQMHRQALELVEKGKEHPGTLATINSLALLLYHKGEYEEAEKLYQKGLR
jgi:tetratricopeptide (TPR) repeat protein